MSDITFKTLGGEGPDLVLIHGFGSDRLSWAGNSPALMEVARVHSLDLPGHGDSLAAEAGDGSPLALAELVADALDANGIKQAHLLGHSLGGSIAIVLALAEPARVLSLSLLAPAGLGRGIDREFLAAFPELASKESAEALLQRLARLGGNDAAHVAIHLFQFNEVPSNGAWLCGLGLLWRPLCTGDKYLFYDSSGSKDPHCP